MKITAKVKNLEQVLKLLSQMPLRLKGATGFISYKLATQFKEDLLQLIPKKKDFAVYRKSITVANVGKDSDGIYAVFVSPDTKGVKKLDSSRTLILVQLKNKNAKGPSSEKIRLLEKYGPWTVDTIPFMPKPGEAKITYKRVTVSGLRKVAKDRNKDRRVWAPEFKALGVKPPQVKVENLKGSKDVPDVALLGLSLEFGLNGQKAIAHWRPAQRNMVANLAKIATDSKEVRQAFSDVKYAGWTQWPPRTREHLSSSDAKKFEAFEDRVRIRTSGT